MNMKRILSLALLALLLCLPVWAMAVTYDLSQYTPIQASDNDIYLFGVNGNESSLISGDIITGTAAPCRIIQTGTIPQNATLTLKDVYIEDGSLSLSVENNGTVTLDLQGENFLSGLYSGLSVHGNLVISTKGNLGTNGIDILYGCNIILPDYYGPIADGMSFTAWYVNPVTDGTTEELMQPGEKLVCNTHVQIIPMFEEISAPIPQPSPDLPKTGDESNVILWSVLACISLFGMMMLVRKRKEA